MRYIMQQKLFTWADTFVIRNEQGQDAFLVRGAVFSFGKQLSFQDMAGNELLAIRQRLLSWGPAYDLYRGGELYATIHKELFTFFNSKFTIEIPGPNALQAEGDFTGHEYTFIENGEVVARVSLQWFSWANTYGVDVADDADAVLILAGTVVIDEISHENQSSGGGIVGGLIDSVFDS